MNSNYSFSNPALQASIERSMPAFDSFLNLLDQITQESKVLENYLQDKGICLPYRFDFNKNSNRCETIEWAYDDQTKKYRLMYGRYRLKNHKDALEALNNDSYETIVLKPLVSTPSGVKMDTAKRLPGFVDGLLSEVKNLHRIYGRKKDSNDTGHAVKKDVNAEKSAAKPIAQFNGMRN